MAISADNKWTTNKSGTLSSGSNPNTEVSSIFANTKDFKDVTTYRLMRGVPDFGSLVQFNPYETGYAAFIICQMPKFMEMLADYDANYNKLISNWAHIIEYEFKSFDGLDNITADSIQLGDDLNNIDVISRVNMQAGSEFSLTYDEKSGSPLTKFAKLYLTGIKDPRTQVKTYHGLIHSGKMEPGFENEVFTFLFITTDNTMRDVEAAYLLIGCQLKQAETNIYNYTKGDIAKRDITVTFSGYPVQSTYINKASKAMLDYLLSSDAGARQIIVNSDEYNYTGAESIGKTLERYGADTTGLKTSAVTYSTDNYYKASSSN